MPLYIHIFQVNQLKTLKHTVFLLLTIHIHILNAINQSDSLLFTNFNTKQHSDALLHTNIYCDIL